MNITHDYRFYNDVLYEIMDEEKSLDNLIARLKNSFTKTELKQHGNTLEELAKYAHKNNEYYFATLYQTEIPVAFIENKDEILKVKYLNQRMFWEVCFVFEKYIKKNKMFLCEIWVRKFMGKENEDLHDLVSDMHFVFTEKGSLTLAKEKIIRDEKIKIEREELEAADLVNVEKNWLPIPEFGEYNYLADYTKIIQPGNLIASIS